MLPDQPEPVTRDLRAYIEDLGKNPNEKHDQRYFTHFLEKYGGLSLHDIDIERRYTINDEEIHFVKKYGYDLIGNPDNPDGTSTCHELFSFMMTSLT